jgi:hypothetical protein
LSSHSYAYDRSGNKGPGGYFQKLSLKKINLRQGLPKLRQFIFGAVDCEPGAIRNGQRLLEQGENVANMFQKTLGALIALPAMRLVCAKGSRKNNFTFLCADALVPGCVAKA